MKKFLKIIEKDYKSENFSINDYVVGGIIVPLVLIVIMALASWLENL